MDLCVEEANHFSPTYPIGTEHILLALLRVREGMGCRVLEFLGVREAEFRATRDALWRVLAAPE